MKFEIESKQVEQDLDSFDAIVDAIDTKPADKVFIQLLSTLCLNAPQCEESISKRFSEKMINIIKQVSFVKMYHSSYRHEFVKGVMRLCNKGSIEPIVVYESLLMLLNCEDKKIREIVAQFIVNDIKKRNSGATPSDLNKKAKLMLSKWIAERGPEQANTGAKILIQLFRRGVWTDQLAVNVLAECCLQKATKVRCTALRFFLNKSSVGAADDSDSESDTEVAKEEKMRKVRLAHRVGKKSQARKKHMEKELDNIKRKKRGSHNRPGSMDLECNVLALQLIRDPQDLAERLLARTKGGSLAHHLRLLQLEMLARLIGYHRLQLGPFHCYLTSLLSPKTLDVTRMLMFAAQAAHDVVSPEDIQPQVKMIADKFVNEGISGDGIAVGLNSIREICTRCPHAMPDDLLALLVEFRDHRDKNVVSACRSLIRLFRQLNPALLPKSERGRPTKETAGDENDDEEEEEKVCEFGGKTAASFVPGAEIITGEEEEEEEDFEECSLDGEEEEDDGDWVDLAGDGDEGAVAGKGRAEKARMTEEATSSSIFSQKQREAIRR